MSGLGRRSITRRKTSNTLGLVCLSIGIVAMVTAMPIARAVTMGTAVGSTTVSVNSVCSGGVQYTPQDGTDYRLDSNPDTVHVPYSVSWSDQRLGSGLTPAYHNFTLAAEHLGNPAGFAQKRVTTTTGTSGSETLWVNVTGVYNGHYVNVTYTASLELQGGTNCPISSSVTMHYHFVYP